jgi:hypothetical protein
VEEGLQVKEWWQLSHGVTLESQVQGASRSQEAGNQDADRKETIGKIPGVARFLNPQES